MFTLNRRGLARCVVTVICCVVAAAADAQVRTTGQIVGTVRDSTGAVVAGAELQLQDIATGNRIEAKSSSTGDFVFPALQPGRYTLTALAMGFQPVVLQSVAVETARAVAPPRPGRMGKVALNAKSSSAVKPSDATKWIRLPSNW